MEELTFTCPICGAEVPRRAKSCPECGACEKSGWSEERYLDGVDLPDEGWNPPGSSPRRLGGGGSGGSKSGMQWLWIAVAVLIVIAFVLMTLRSTW